MGMKRKARKKVVPIIEDSKEEIVDRPISEKAAVAKQEDDDFFVSMEEAFPKKRLYYLWTKSLRWVYLNRIFVMVGIAMLFIVMIIFGAKFFLMFNFLIGKDTYISLTADNTSFLATQSEIRTLSFKSSASTNFFCKASCYSTLTDLSNSETLFKEEFMLKTLSPIQREFNITVPGKGSGLLLYSYEISCRSEKTLLCQTDGREVKKSILADIFYDRSDSTKSALDALKDRLGNASYEIRVGYLVSRNISSLMDDKDAYFLDDDLKDLAATVLDGYSYLDDSLLVALSFWESEDIALLEKALKDIEGEIKELNQTYTVFLAEFEDALMRVQSNYDYASESKYILDAMRLKFITDADLAVSLSIASEDYLTMADAIRSNPSSEESAGLAQDVLRKAITIESSYINFTNPTQSFLALSLDIKTQIMCSLDVNYVGCNSTDYITDLPVLDSLGQPDYYASLCDARASMINQTSSIMISLAETPAPEENETSPPNSSIDALEYYSSLKDENAAIILDYIGLADFEYDKRQILLLEMQSIIDSIKDLPADPLPPISGLDNLSKAGIISVLQNDSFGEYCDQMMPKNYQLPKIIEIPVGSIYNRSMLPILKNGSEVILGAADISIEINEPQCCLGNVCVDCCITAECRNDNRKYPVLMIHGHAFDKSTSAERNMFIMSSLKTELAKRRLIDAGYLNSYSADSSFLFMENSSVVTIGSYYFDSLTEDGKYTFLQRKNDDIDDYALRLRDMVNLLKLRSGRDKVILVAHSMGGLVARRYLQLFGSADVAKAVYIFTPNHGINGSTAKFCTFTGEVRECSDMEEGSFVLKKLYQQGKQPVETFNFIGKGCSMDGIDGDGVVTAESAYLEGANNFYFNGSCTKLGFFHNDILESDRYPSYLKMIADVITDGTG